MKALMVIDGRTISPFDIESIVGATGSRHRWDQRKLWHPFLETYIKRLPWWKRGTVRRRFPQAYHYHRPYVQVHLDDRWRSIRIECRNNQECDEMATRLRSEWDQALAKFHGTGCNFNQQEK
jgi:hypothetical protein